jgi:hypothetical protein
VEGRGVMLLQTYLLRVRSVGFAEYESPDFVIPPRDGVQRTRPHIQINQWDSYATMIFEFIKNGWFSVHNAGFLEHAGNPFDSPQIEVGDMK